MKTLITIISFFLLISFQDIKIIYNLTGDVLYRFEKGKVYDGKQDHVGYYELKDDALFIYNNERKLKTVFLPDGWIYNPDFKGYKGKIIDNRLYDKGLKPWGQINQKPESK
jgi:hypothetical protein